MKILLCNYRYFISGGPERYLFNIKDLLESNGHSIIPFSISNALNKPTRYSDFFVSAIGDDQVYFNPSEGKAADKIRVLERLFYSFETHTNVKKLVEHEKPDVAYVLHYLRKLSPSLLSSLRKKRIPIVVRLSDYGMLCPENHFYRKSAICTKCIDSNLTQSVINKCVKGSASLSMVNLLATTIHNMSNVFNYVDKFVCTNTFMYQMMLKAGYSEDRLCVIPTFSDEKIFVPEKFAQRRKLSKTKFITFSGRLVENKGVHLLIDAINVLVNEKGIDCQLKIMGNGDEKYIDRLKSSVSRHCLSMHVTFLGSLDTEDIAKHLMESDVSVVPSLWYENLPNALIESLYCGTPVICPKQGSFVGLIKEKISGLYFEPNNYVNLAEKLNELFTSYNYNRELIATEARNEFGASSHYSKLMSLFSTLKL